MFAPLLQTDFIDTIKQKAIDTRIKDDWDKFKIIFEEVEKYISQNKLILSDINMLVGKTLMYKESYLIYCNNPFRHANNLVNKISEAILSSNDKNAIHNGDAKWIQLSTAIEHKELSIMYKNRRLIQIYALSERDININTIVQPVKHVGFYTSNTIYLMPQEIELVDIYKKLYSPEYANEWKDLLEIEPLLIEKTQERIKTRAITAGLDNSKNIDINTLKSLLVLKMLSNSDFVLIGNWAVKLIEMGILGGILHSSYEKLQIITEYNIEKAFEIIKDYVKILIPKYPNEITYKEHELFLPKEYRTKRYTVYIQLHCIKENKCPVREKPFIDIFTNGSYELIPWVSSSRFMKKKNLQYPKNVKIGNPYVLLRFMMIDFWILRIVYDKELIMKNIFYKKIEIILANILKIKNPNRLGGIINKAFSLENYIGKYSNEFIYFKDLISQKRIPIYNPFVYKKEHGKYREI